MDITFEEIKEKTYKYFYNDNTQLGTINRTNIELARWGSAEARNNIKQQIAFYLAQKNLTIKQYQDILKNYQEQYKNYQKEFHPSDDLQDNILKLTQLIYQETIGLSVIDTLVFSELDEVGINGYDYIWIQESGFKQRVEYETIEGRRFPLQFKDNNHLLEMLIARASSYQKTKDLNETETSYLGSSYDGNRIKILLPPNTSKPRANFRKFLLKNLTDEEQKEKNSITDEFIEFLYNIFPGRPNIKIIGEQGSGKSTFLRYLVKFVNEDLSIGTLEVDYELRLEEYFQGRNIHDFRVTSQMDIEKGFEEMLKQNRDIIIVGEIAGPKEQTVSLKAKLRNNKGSMDTFHSKSPTDAIFDGRNLLMQSGFYNNERIALYDMARAEDIIIQLRLNRKTKKRYVQKVSEIIEHRDTLDFEERELFVIDSKTLKLKPVQMPSDHLIRNLLDYECTSENIKKIEQIFKGCKYV